MAPNPGLVAVSDELVADVSGAGSDFSLSTSPGKSSFPPRASRVFR